MGQLGWFSPISWDEICPLTSRSSPHSLWLHKLSSAASLLGLFLWNIDYRHVHSSPLVFASVPFAFGLLLWRVRICFPILWIWPILGTRLSCLPSFLQLCHHHMNKSSLDDGRCMGRWLDDGLQDLRPPNKALWHIEYFKSREFEKNSRK